MTNQPPSGSAPQPHGPTRIVLAGGGHAHLHLMDAATKRGASDITWVLVSPFPRHHYSGMVPGYLAGTYEEDALAFDLARIASRLGAQRIQGRITRISMAERHVEVVADGEGEPGNPSPITLSFDRLSLDLGSVPVGMDTPGVSEWAATVRPMSRAVALRARLDALVAAQPSGSVRPLRIGVVGGGAGAVEVALALTRRIRKAGRTPQTILFEGGPEILQDFSEQVRFVALSVLHDSGIEVRTGTRVTAVGPDSIDIKGGSKIPVDLVVWLTGAAPPPVLATSDLPRADDGFFHVDGSLQAVDGTPAWGAGDCIALAGHPTMPRAGVYAVRQSPVLAANVLAGKGVRRFSPQKSFLSLLNTADGRALLRWRAIVAHTTWAWKLKDRIDRRFMSLYQG